MLVGVLARFGLQDILKNSQRVMLDGHRQRSMDYAFGNSLPGVPIVRSLDTQKVQQHVKLVAVVGMRRRRVVLEESVELVDDRSVNQLEQIDGLFRIDPFFVERFDERVRVDRIVVLGELLEEPLDPVVKNRPHIAKSQRPGVEELLAIGRNELTRLGP